MSLSDYSDIEKEISEAPELKILPAGSEVKARIVKIVSGTVDSESSDYYDCDWYSVTFDVPDELLCPMFNDFFWDLASRDKLSPKQEQAALRHFRNFAEAFGIDYSRPFSWEDDLPGSEGWMILKIVKDKTGEYPDKNGVSKYVSPK